MKIAITGATGLIGSELQQRFASAGDTITILSRREEIEGVPHKVSTWHPAKGEINAADLEGVDLVINLAGENLVSRWTDSQKKKILESRVDSTKLISETVARLSDPPKIMLSASGVNYYGTRDPEEEVDESSDLGEGFLPGVCREWEAATKPAEEAGIRVIHTRLGMVLSPEGGALAKMLPIFQKGMGGKVGDGNQMISWVSLRELYPVFRHLIENEQISGPVNVCSPNPVANEKFTETLAEILDKPAFMTAKPFMVKLAFGEMAEEILLKGVRVRPSKLLETNYVFEFPRIDQALKELLG